MQFMFWSQEIRIYIAEKGREIYQRSIFLFLFLLAAGGAKAQQASFSQQETKPYYKRYLLQAGAGTAGRLQAQHLSPEDSFTAVAFSLPDEAAFAGLYCVVGSDSLPVSPAVHQPEHVEGVVSELLVFDVPQTGITLSAALPKAGIWLHFIQAGSASPTGKATGQKERYRRLASPCDEPQVVPQSEWRTGLPEPDYSRSFNEVEHLVVHHSATGNQLTDYTNVVRNIYIYHREVNGWSDIGYNYLIAPDGTLFAGRDPAGGAQDNVRGAHFCGQNSETMGVCLLGDYTQTQPKAAMLLSLEHLLSWKTYKEQLDATGERPHSANPRLPVIAGHQDGCATACPGRYVYEKLPALRLAVAENLQACEQGTPAPFVYFAPRAQEVCLGGLPEEELDELQIFDVQGRAVSGTLIRLPGQDLCFKLIGLVPGVYFLQAERGRQLIRRRFMLF